MAPLDALPPDQRAVVSLVAGQGRSYDELAGLLGIGAAAVRARAHAGLVALAPAVPLSPDEAAPLADYLLGQLDADTAAAVAGRLAGAPRDRAWAHSVAAALSGLPDVRLARIPAATDPPGGTVPPLAAPASSEDAAADASPGAATEDRDAAPAAADSPAEASPGAAVHAVADASPAAAAEDPDAAADAAPGAAAPDHDAAPAADAPPGEAPVSGEVAAADSAAPGRPPAAVAAEVADREVHRPRSGRSPGGSSKVGGAVLLGLLVAALVAAAAWLLTSDGGDDPEAAATATATATATSTAAPATAVGQIDLRPPGGSSDARGLMTIYAANGQLQFTLEATGLPANAGDERYAVWFTGGEAAALLGIAESAVGRAGTFSVAGPSTEQIDAFPQALANHRSVVVTRETSDRPRTPGPAVLRGRLPSGGDD